MAGRRIWSSRKSTEPPLEFARGGQTEKSETTDRRMEEHDLAGFLPHPTAPARRPSRPRPDGRDRRDRDRRARRRPGRPARAGSGALRRPAGGRRFGHRGLTGTSGAGISRRRPLLLAGALPMENRIRATGNGTGTRGGAPGGDGGSGDARRPGKRRKRTIEERTAGTRAAGTSRRCAAARSRDRSVAVVRTP